MRIQEIQRSKTDPSDDWESTGQLDSVPNMKMVPGSDRYGYVLRQFAGQELLNFTGSDLAINFYDTKPEGSDRFSNDIIAHDYSNVMQRGDTLVIADPWVSAGLK
jgi:hypothetical protein